VEALRKPGSSDEAVRFSAGTNAVSNAASSLEMAKAPSFVFRANVFGVITRSVSERPSPEKTQLLPSLTLRVTVSIAAADRASADDFRVARGARKTPE